MCTFTIKDSQSINLDSKTLAKKFKADVVSSEWSGGQQLLTLQSSQDWSRISLTGRVKDCYLQNKNGDVIPSVEMHS